VEEEKEQKTGETGGCRRETGCVDMKSRSAERRERRGKRWTGGMRGGCKGTGGNRGRKEKREDKESRRRNQSVVNISERYKYCNNHERIVYSNIL
jgi:hypothetical protein